MPKELPIPIILGAAVVVTIAAASYLVYLDYPAYTDQQIATQILREDKAFCAKLGLAQGTQKAGECEADLVDLRHGHEKLIASKTTF